MDFRKWMCVFSFISIGIIPLSSVAKDSFPPSNKELFYFAELPPDIAALGYTTLCSKPKKSACDGRRYPYSKYVGKAAYFASEQPIISGGQRFFLIITEQGEELYLKTAKFTDDRFHWSNLIISAREYDKKNKPSEQELFPGSQIKITKMIADLEDSGFFLPDGSRKTFDEIKLFRKFQNEINFNDELAVLLLPQKIEYDLFEDLWRVKPAEKVNQALVPTLIIKNKAPLLTLSFTYSGKDWIFLNAIKVAIGDYRWSTTVQDAKRDNSADLVWEWVTMIEAPKVMELINALNTEKPALIRFSGSRGKEDIKLPLETKDIVTVFNTMRRAFETNYERSNAKSI